MKSYPTDHVRNVLVVGHSGAGKTTLVESLLYATGAVSRTGRVEDGTTVTDYEPEEARKGISVSLALAPVEHEGFKINLLDAPGFPDFLGEVRSALQAVDAVLFVVSAVDGVETQTEVVWSMASERGLPCAFFVNKLDRDRASFERTLAQIKDTFAQTIEPVYLPIGEAATFTGLVGLLSGMAFDYTDGKRSEAPVPDALAGEVETLRGQLIEAIIQEAENEALMERYLEGEELEPSDLIEDLKAAIGAGKLVPVLAGSALTGVGTTELLEVLTTGFASPATSAPWPGTVPGTGAEVTRSADPDGPLAAYVFKTISDPYVGRLSMFRVVSGTFRGDTTVTNATTGKDERAAHLLTMRGKNQESLGELAAGDIGAVAKLTETSTGDTLCDKSDPVALASPSMPEPLLPVAVQPKSKGDEEKLSSGLARAEAEDLTLRVTRNTETRQTVLWGLGETHVELTLERLKRRYGVEVTTVGLRLPYKETFKKAVKAKGRHVKQSGGHGQYGICDIEVEPLPRGQGFEFVDKIYGGAVPHQFIPSVEKGVRKAMDDGLLAGYPVEDVRVTLYDGKYHSVDSSDMAFQVAGSLAMKEAAAAGDMALLEPILEVEVLIPDDYVGDVLGDLSSRRGRVVGTEPVGVGRTLVRATVPESEFTRYAIDLRSMTRGRGSFSRSFSHYEDLPANMAAKVVEQAQAEE